MNYETHIIFLLGISFASLLLLNLLVKRNRLKKLDSDIIINLIINKTLNMSKGKIISQIAHAISHVLAHMVSNKEIYKNWKKSGKRINIYEGDFGDIEELSNKAHIFGIKYSKIHDAGRTQIPSGSNTVLIIGPTSAKICHEWFNYLKLIT